MKRGKDKSNTKVKEKKIKISPTNTKVKDKAYNWNKSSFLLHFLCFFRSSSSPVLRLQPPSFLSLSSPITTSRFSFDTLSLSKVKSSSPVTIQAGRFLKLTLEQSKGHCLPAWLSRRRWPAARTRRRNTATSEEWGLEVEQKWETQQRATSKWATTKTLEFFPAPQQQTRSNRGSAGSRGSSGSTDFGRVWPVQCSKRFSSLTGSLSRPGPGRTGRSGPVLVTLRVTL